MRMRFSARKPMVTPVYWTTGLYWPCHFLRASSAFATDCSAANLDEIARTPKAWPGYRGRPVVPASINFGDPVKNFHFVAMLLSAVILAGTAQAAPLDYPATPMRPVSDAYYFGTVVNDDHRWLEQVDSVEVNFLGRGAKRADAPRDRCAAASSGDQEGVARDDGWRPA